MKYEIVGGNMPAVICHLEGGEAISTDNGAMSWMSENMEMTTEGGGGLGKALGRMFSGENIFRNLYRAKGGEGFIALTTNFPGAIVVKEITPDRPVIIQKSAFLACSEGVATEVFFNKKAGAGLFGGEGFIMQKVSGNGLLFMEIDGSAVEHELAAGEKLIVDTGSLAEMDITCQIDVVTVKGVKNVLFGGEGLFNTVITGPGTVVLQTMPIAGLAQSLIPYMPSSSSNSYSSSHE